jgi:hypothetical protein
MVARSSRKCTCRYACTDCTTFRFTKLAHAQQHDVHISYTKLLPHRVTNVESTDRSSFTYVRDYSVAFISPIFTKVTTPRQMFVEIFCTELYPSWKGNAAKRAKKLCASITKVWNVSESIPTQLTLTGQIFVKKSYIEFHDNSKKKRFIC